MFKFRNPDRKLKTLVMTAMFAALAVIPGAAMAESDQREAITLAFNAAIQNIPGKSIVAIVVSYAPGGKTPAHHHAHSAFVTGYVLSGAIRSQVDDGAARVFHAGESWTEEPGAHHPISENASATEPAKLLAVFVVDTKEAGDLTTVEGQ
jgi:quercetin dioxygenase-like cupin family protein